jgi:hypothetical protein
MTLPTPGKVQLSWSADASDMLLESTTDLTAPNWQTVSTSPRVGANQVTWVGPQTAGAQFFRLRQP